MLLVTQEFFDSKFISNVELKHFVEESRKKNVVIFWVAVGYTAYEETPLVDIQCANLPDSPLKSLSEAEQERTIVEICRKIKAAFRQH